MVRGEPSGADRALTEELGRAGFHVSHAQLERWRSFGLLPGHARRYLGRGQGSSSSLDPEVLRMAQAIAARVSGTRPIQEAALRILIECPELPLAEKAVKASLVWFVERRLRSSYRKAADAVADRSELTEADEDVAAQKILDHYKGLRKPVRAALDQAFPGMADLAVGATLGIGAIGRDRFLKIIDDLDPTGAEGVAKAFRDAVAGEPGLSIVERPLVVAPVYRAEYQKKVILEAGMTEIDEARELLSTVAARVRMLNILHVLLPENEIVTDAVEVFRESIILRPLLLMYSATESAGAWASQVKSLIMMLVQDNASGVYRSVDELLRTMLDEHLARLTSEAMLRIRASEAD